MEKMTPEAKRIRKIYKRKYRQENKEKINKQQREWRAKNPDKVRAYQAKYWSKKAIKIKDALEE